MKTKLKLFFNWGIQFEEPLKMEDKGSRPVHYAGKRDLEMAILKAYPFVHTVNPMTMPPKQETSTKPLPTSVSINIETE